MNLYVIVKNNKQYQEKKKNLVKLMATHSIVIKLIFQRKTIYGKADQLKTWEQDVVLEEFQCFMLDQEQNHTSFYTQVVSTGTILLNKKNGQDLHSLWILNSNALNKSGFIHIVHALAY